MQLTPVVLLSNVTISYVTGCEYNNEENLCLTSKIYHFLSVLIIRSQKALCSRLWCLYQQTCMSEEDTEWMCEDCLFHYSDVIMSMMASQITSLMIVNLTFYSGTDQRKHQSSAPLAFVRGIHRWLVNSLHKKTVTRKMFPFDDVIMFSRNWYAKQLNNVIMYVSLSRKWLCAHSSVILMFIKHKVTLKWAHKEFATPVHTLSYIYCLQYGIENYIRLVKNGTMGGPWERHLEIYLKNIKNSQTMLNFTRGFLMLFVRVWFVRWH